METIIKSPGSLCSLGTIGTISIFLAGSIEEGKAENWQSRMENILRGKPVTILNPRRDDYNPDWEQSIHNPPFKQQVDWELDALDRADLIVMYFDPNTKSPISLLELGRYSAIKPDSLVVCCPDGFWRKGNVEIVCSRYDISLFDDYENFEKYVVETIEMLL